MMSVNVMTLWICFLGGIVAALTLIEIKMWFDFKIIEVVIQTELDVLMRNDPSLDERTERIKIEGYHRSDIEKANNKAQVARVWVEIIAAFLASMLSAYTATLYEKAGYDQWLSVPMVIEEAQETVTNGADRTIPLLESLEVNDRTVMLNDIILMVSMIILLTYVSSKRFEMIGKCGIKKDEKNNIIESTGIVVSGACA